MVRSCNDQLGNTIIKDEYTLQLYLVCTFYQTSFNYRMTDFSCALFTMHKQLYSLNLYLTFSPSNLTNKCLLSCLFSILSTKTAPNTAALAFISFLHRHWNTIIFVMLFRRSIPSCRLRSFEHLD